MTLKELNETTTAWLKAGMDPESILDVDLMDNDEMDCTAVIISVGQSVLDLLLLSGDNTPENYLEQMNTMIADMLGLDPSLGSWGSYIKRPNDETLN